MRRRWLLAVLLAMAIGWAGGAARAQEGIPNGVFVLDAEGAIWLVLDGRRVNVPLWHANFEEIRALPKSNLWAVANPDGAIVAGQPPSWIAGDAATGSLRPLSPLESRVVVPEATGQSATSIFSGEAIKATVLEMSVLEALPEVKTGRDHFVRRNARGKFVAVAVEIENVGKRAVCCVPGYTLRDARGRHFTGWTARADDQVKHTARSVYLMDLYENDLQPNLPVGHVLLFDVPEDARALVLSPDR